MANPFINIYKDVQTEEPYSGTVVSSDGTFTAPVEVTLDASQAESKKVRLGVRTEYGYLVDGDTTISIVNDFNNHWFIAQGQAAMTDFTTKSITMSNVGNENAIFFVRATSSTSEGPGYENSCSIQLQAKIIQDENS